MNIKSSKQPWGSVMEVALRGYDAAVAEIFERVRIRFRWEVQLESALPPIAVIPAKYAERLLLTPSRHR